MSNQPPTLVGLTPSVVFGENAVNAAPALIDADVTFMDPEANFAGGSIAILGLIPEDRVSITHQGFGAGQIGLFGVNVTYDGIAIGTFSGGVGGTLTIDLNSSATSTAVGALLQNLAYANVSDSPTATRTLTIQIEDGDGAQMVRPAEYEELVGAANPLNVDLGLQSAPAFVDVDFDGDLDFVAGDRNGQIRVLRNDGATYSELLGAANPFDGVDVGEYSRPAFADLDGDGDMDAVIGTSGGLLRTWRNTGGTFTELLGTDNPFNPVDVGEIAAPAFVDIDNDGDLDLVVGELFGTLRTYLNSGGVFTLAASNPLSAVDVGFFSSPGFADLDGDGDMDALVGSNMNSLTVLRNEGGVFTGMPFEDNPFASFGIASYATPAFADLDGDGDLDAMFGQFNGGFRVLQNVAPLGRDIVIEVSEESDVPTLEDVAPSVSFLENAVNATPAPLDADVTFSLGSSSLAGGRLIVSGLLPEDRISVIPGDAIAIVGSAITFNGTHIGNFSGGQGNPFIVDFAGAAGAAEVEALIEQLGYANISQTPTADRTLHFNIVDSAGGAMDGPLSLTPFPVDPFPAVPASISNPAPAFTDLDGDGDADLVLGDLFGLLRVYRNDGGTFVELSGAANPYSGIDVFFDSMPSFVDLDGDGDQDMILGEDSIPGVLRTYSNDGGDYVQLTGPADPFAGVSFGRATAPAPADVDGDGDIDLIVGGLDGHMRYFENAGAGLVERTGVENPFDAIIVGGYGSPAWIDVDGDGDLDLAIGSSVGADASLRTWRNDGGAFTELIGSASPFAGIDLTNRFGVRPAFADIDGDGDLDTVLGTAIDGVLGYRNDASFGPSIAVHVTAEGDVPSLTGLGMSATFAENAVNAAQALIDADVLFAAGSGGLAGGALTVSGLLAEDRVSVLSDGTITVSGTSLLYLGVEIGAVAGGVGGELTITFNAAASSSGIDALIEHLAYANVSDTPTAARALTLDVVDGNGAGLSGGPQSLTVNVVAENDSPRLENFAASATFAENAVNAAPALIDDVVNLSDPEANLAGGTLTVTGLLAEDRIGLRDQGLGNGTITLFGTNVVYDGLAIGTFSGGNGNTFALFFNSVAIGAAVEAVIENLTYANTSDTPTSVRVLSLSVSDALGATGSSDISISVTAEGDDPPVAVDDAIALAEDQTAAGNLFADNGSGPDFDPDGSSFGVAAVNGLAGNVGTTFTLASGARLRVNSDGTYVYDPNGAFDYLGAPGSGPLSVATDSFTYGLDGGDTATATVTITWVDGNDVLIGTPGNDALHGGLGKDRVYGRGGHDELGGGSGNDSLYGDAGDDRLDGGKGRDHLEGGMGSDMLFGGGDMDTLNGGKGADEMAGGDDNDSYRVDHVGDLVIELAGGGKDRVLSSISYTLPDEVEQLRLLGGGDLSGRGNGLDNLIIGNAGDNYLSGYGGDDRIEAGDGDDILIGGRGLDILIGGAGQDRFLFDTAPAKSNTDRIYDFASGEDRIVLDEDQFAAAGRGTLSAGAFQLGATAQDADDRILYDAATGRIYYDPDGAGSAAAVMFAAVGVGTTLVHSDFVIG